MNDILQAFLNSENLSPIAATVFGICIIIIFYQLFRIGFYAKRRKILIDASNEIQEGHSRNLHQNWTEENKSVKHEENKALKFKAKKSHGVSFTKKKEELTDEEFDLLISKMHKQLDKVENLMDNIVLDGVILFDEEEIAESLKRKNRAKKAEDKNSKKTEKVKQSDKEATDKNKKKLKHLPKKKDKAKDGPEQRTGRKENQKSKKSAKKLGGKPKPENKGLERDQLEDGSDSDEYFFDAYDDEEL